MLNTIKKLDSSFIQRQFQSVVCHIVLPFFKLVMSYHFLNLEPKINIVPVLFSKIKYLEYCITCSIIQGKIICINILHCLEIHFVQLHIRLDNAACFAHCNLCIPSSFTSLCCKCLDKYQVLPTLPLFSSWYLEVTCNILKHPRTCFVPMPSLPTGENLQFSCFTVRSACFMTHLDIVKLLVINKADIQKPNFNGGTCLINRYCNSYQLR